MDGRGNVNLDGFDFDFLFVVVGAQAGDHRLRHTRRSEARQVADGIEFPNGIVVDAGQLDADHRRVLRRSADRVRHRRRRHAVEPAGVDRASDPTGSSLDAEGAIWVDVGEFGDNLVGRVRRGRRGARPDPARPAPASPLHARRREPRDAVHARGRLAHVGGLRGEHRAADPEAARTGQVLTAPASRRPAGRRHGLVEPVRRGGALHDQRPSRRRWRRSAGADREDAVAAAVAGGGVDAGYGSGPTCRNCSATGRAGSTGASRSGG